jgi:hypothetical protein
MTVRDTVLSLTQVKERRMDSRKKDGTEDRISDVVAT